MQRRERRLVADLRVARRVALGGAEDVEMASQAPFTSAAAERCPRAAFPPCSAPSPSACSSRKSAISSSAPSRPKRARTDSKAESPARPLACRSEQNAWTAAWSGGEVCGLFISGNRIDDLRIEAGLARQLLVDEPLVLAGPAARGDQHREFDELRRQRRLPAQLLAERLQAAGELGMVDERDEGAAHLAARPGGDFGRDLALHRRHLARGELGETLCHAPMMADVLLVVHFLIAAFIVLGLLAVWLGAALGWPWVRNPWFRYLHLAAIGFRRRRGGPRHRLPAHRLGGPAARRRASCESFVGRWVRALLFYQAPEWVFTAAYVAWTSATLVNAPPGPAPRQPQRRSSFSPAGNRARRRRRGQRWARPSLRRASCPSRPFRSPQLFPRNSSPSTP